MPCVSISRGPQTTSSPWPDAVVISEEEDRVCDAPHVRCAWGNAPSGTCLGIGSYGTVQRCSFSTARGQHIHDAAVKTAVGNDAADLRAAEDALTAEARAICKVRSRCRCDDGCRHVPRLLAVIPSPESAASSRARSLVFPAYPTCLYEHLQDAKAARIASGIPAPVLPLRTRLRILRDLARALSCAARARIAHCDVKPSNIMLDGDGGVVLIDWGLATPHGEYCQGAFGTAAYVPPEMLDSAGFVVQPSLDIWSLGVVCLEMVLPRRLAPGLHRDDVYSLLESRRLYAEELAQLAAAPEALHCESAWAEVILSCLEYNPQRRATHQHLESFATLHLAENVPPAAGGVQSPLHGAGAAAPARSSTDAAAAPDRSFETDSSVGAFVGNCRGIPVQNGAPSPAPQTAAEIAASTAAVLRLASVNSSAAFDLLRADANSAFLSEAATPEPAALPSPQPAACQECLWHPPAPNLRRGGPGPSACLGPRAATAPAPLDGAHPLSSCELESFDRFTDRARPASPRAHTGTLPRPSDPDPTAPVRPAAHGAAAPARKRTRLPQPRSRHRSSSGPWHTPLAAAADHAPGGRTCPDAVAVVELDEHRHPFGLSPTEPCLPFAVDPVITADTPRANAYLSPPSRSGHSTPDSACLDSLLHLHLPRVRTVRPESGGGDRLPDVEDLLRSRSSSGSDRGTRNRCQMSFGKLGPHTPVSACALAATAAAAPLLPPWLGGAVGELRPPSRPEVEEVPQHAARCSVFPALGDGFLFRMDDDPLCPGSPGGPCSGRSPSGRGIAPWLQEFHVAADRCAAPAKRTGGQRAGGGAVSPACASEGGVHASRRRRTYGDASLHAAHCSVLSDLTDVFMPHSPAPDAAPCCEGDAGAPPGHHGTDVRG